MAWPRAARREAGSIRRAPRRAGSRNARERLLEVGDEIGHVLDARRVAHQAFRNPGRAPLLVAALDMARHHRWTDHGLDAAQVRRAMRELQARQESANGVEPAA